jgi:hypothetical protein
MNAIAAVPEVVAPPPVETPDPFAPRRRFLVWAVATGFLDPRRLTERIVAEVESEAAE